MSIFRRTQDNPFASTLWIDQRDAGARITALRRNGHISEEDAKMLEHFRTEGFVKLSLDTAQKSIDELVADVDRLWAEKPPDALYSAGHPFLRPMSLATDDERRPGVRLQEVQAHSRAARRLYLHPRLHYAATLILGEPVVALQSILFEFGSAQALHRDPVFVPTPVPGHLLAAWIALEDIHPDSGPLRYVPRSHRLPPFEFRPGLYRYDPRLVSEADVQREQEWLAEEMAHEGTKVVTFTPKKGEAFLWHAALYHGGEPIRDPARTRKSYVVHYSTRRAHKERVLSINDADGLKLVRTRQLLRDGEAVGFHNPLASSDRKFGATLSDRVRNLRDRVLRRIGF